MRILKGIYLSVAIIFFVSIASDGQRVKEKDIKMDNDIVSSSDSLIEKNLSDEEEQKLEYLFLEGVRQKKFGEITKAAANFSECLKIDSTSSASMFELSQIKYTNKDYNGASALLEKAVSLQKGNKWYKILLAEIYQQQKKYKKAADIYGSLYQSDTEKEDYLFKKAGLLAMGKQYEQSIASYNELEKKLGLVGQISLAKENVYLLWGKKEEAFNEIQRLINKHPDDPQYYGIMGEMYMKDGDYKNALKYYNKALKLDPDNGYAEFSLSGFYEEEGNFEKAFEYLEKAFRNDGIDANTKIRYYLMQKSGKEESTWTGAQMNILISILLDKYPDNNLMYSAYAQCLIRNNKLKEAGEYLEKYLNDNPSDKEMWQKLLFIHNNNRNFEGLYNDGEKAISFFNEEPVFYAFHALGALQLKKYKEVLDDCQKGESLIKNNPELIVQFELFKADALYKLNRIKEVFISYDKILKSDPKNYMVMNNYAYYLSVLGKNFDKAENMSRQVIQANPDSAIYLDTYAWVLFKQKKYSKALTFMKMALKSGGDKSGVQVEHYGDILFCLGEKDKALENWKKAKKLGDTSEILDKKIREQRYIESKELE